MSEEAVNQDKQPTEAEEKAKLQGWQDYDAWVDAGGDPDQWRDADTFLQRGNEIQGILKERLDKVTSELAQSRQDMQRMFKEFGDKLTAAEKRAYKQAEADYKQQITELKKQQRQAVEDGDVTAFEEADKKIGELEKNKPSPEDHLEGDGKSGDGGQPQTDPDLQAWKADNAWFDKYQDMQMYAISIAPYVEAQNPQLKGRALYDKISEKVKSEFPDRFENPKREKASVEGDAGKKGGGSSGKKIKSVKDLPKEDRKEAERMIKTYGITEEEYLQAYREEAGE
jgi:hypothetical protein